MSGRRDNGSGAPPNREGHPSPARRSPPDPAPAAPSSGPSRPVAPAPASDSFGTVLSDLAALTRGKPEGLAVADLLEGLGTRAHGAAILLLALPETVPLPIPSVGIVLGVPLIMVSAHLALFGESARLPRRALRWRIPARAAAVISTRVAPVLKRAERWSHPRFQMMARRERLAGMVCLALSVALFLPIPLMNMPIALALVVLAWGLVQRDGLILILGLGLSILVLGAVLAGSAALMRMVSAAV